MTIFQGFKRKSGTFINTSNESISYDNTIIYITSDEDSSVTGSYAEQFKVKTSDLTNVFGTNDLKQFINKEIEIKYSISNMKVSVIKVYLVE